MLLSSVTFSLSCFVSLLFSRRSVWLHSRRSVWLHSRRPGVPCYSVPGVPAFRVTLFPASRRSVLLCSRRPGVPCYSVPGVPAFRVTLFPASRRSVLLCSRRPGVPSYPRLALFPASRRPCHYVWLCSRRPGAPRYPAWLFSLRVAPLECVPRTSVCSLCCWFLVVFGFWFVATSIVPPLGMPRLFYRSSCAPRIGGAVRDFWESFWMILKQLVKIVLTQWESKELIWQVHVSSEGQAFQDMAFVSFKYVQLSWSERVALTFDLI